MAEIIDRDRALFEPEVLTYEVFGRAVRELGQAIHDSGYEPDWLVAIARGGLVIGGALAYALGQKNIATVNVEFYTGIDERLDVPVELPPVLALDDLANRKVLVVDDVADTGETLKLVLQKCAPAVDDVRAAVLYEKPRSIVRSDYVWRRTDRWIDFPWSSEPVIVRTQRSPLAAKPPQGAQRGSQSDCADAAKPARGEAAARCAAREPG